MRLLFGAFLTFAIAAAIGLGGTYLALTQGLAFGGVTIGAWSMWPRTGTADIDPYARAAIARSGELPTGLGDGITFFAYSDDSHAALDGRCQATVSGVTPQARYWTLTIYDSRGQLVANSVGRHGFTSQEISRRSDGSFEIVLSPRARPGNWLPTGGIDRYVLVLRLYDTPVGVATRAGREAPMPAIAVKECQ